MVVWGSSWEKVSAFQWLSCGVNIVGLQYVIGNSQNGMKKYPTQNLPNKLSVKKKVA